MKLTNSAATAWRCIKVFYFSKEKDALLVSAVFPAISAFMQDPNKLVVIRRDWRGGPNIQIYISNVTGAEIQTVVSAIEKYLKMDPSTRELTESFAKDQHQMMNKFEAQQKAFEPLSADNTVVVNNDAPVFSFLPNKKSQHVATFFHSQATECLLQLYEQSKQNLDKRFYLTFKLALCYAHVMAGLPGGYFFTRTYSEKTIASLPGDTEQNFAKFEALFQSSKPTLDKWLDNFMQQAVTDANFENDPLLQTWTKLLCRTRELAEGFVADGYALTVDNDVAADAYARVGWDADELLSKTEFLSFVSDNQQFKDYVHEDDTMKVHVFLVNQFYSFFSNIGLSASKKNLLLYFVARTVECKFDIDPMKVIKQHFDGE